MNVKKYLQIFKFIVATSLLVIGMNSHANASSNAHKSQIPATLAATKFMQVAAVDLSRVLAYVMGPGDIFQGYENVIYRNVQALRLRIFNQNSGRIRYIFVDAQTGQIL